MSMRRVSWVAGALSLVVAAGCGLAGRNNEAPAPPDPVTGSPTDTGPVFEPITESPTPSPSPSATKSTTPKRKPSRAAPTADPNNFQAPECATYEGKAVSKAKAKAALNAAAAKHYWPVSAPHLTVSADLVRSIAWNESGWQSNIVNCDGGYGLMQVMPGTVDMVNTRFEKDYDPHNYRQNAIIGANYLAWLTRNLGDNYFGKNYSLSPSKCKSTSSWCLLNAVIAAYHAGVGSVEQGAASKKLPSPDYVYVVRSLMTSCYCDRY